MALDVEIVTSRLDSRKTERVQTIAVSLLRQSRYQVRDQAFEDRYALQDLASSIKAAGLLELPRVRRCTDNPDCFELISGHRRVRAVSRHLGWKEIKCIVCEDLDETNAFRLGMAENVHRNNLSAYEEGIAYLLCQKLFGLSDERLVELFNRSRITIVMRRELASAANGYLKLVPPSERNTFLRNFSLGHRDILRKLQNNEEIARVIEMVARGVSARNVQRYVDVMGYTSEPRRKAVKLQPKNQDQAAESELSNCFDGEKVTRSHLVHFLYNIPPRTHLLLLYEDLFYGEALSFLYLSQGLARGEEAVYATQEAADEVRKLMEEHGLDVRYYENERGTLHIREIADPSKNPGGLDDGLREMYKEIFEGVRRPCRVVGTSNQHVNNQGLRLANATLENSTHGAFEDKASNQSLCNIFNDFRGSVMCRYHLNGISRSSHMEWIRNIASSHHVSIFLPDQKQEPLLLNTRVGF